MIIRYWDRLYDIEYIHPEELEIFQAPEFARLRRVSLSALPTWSHPVGMCSSRAEHSIGVRHLAKFTVQNFVDDAENIIAAATLHDIGSPPFSHLSEHFQKEVLGQNHEEFSKNIILNSVLADIVQKRGGNVDRVIRLIMGEGPLGALINGTIDLDNLDNTLRFGLSMGIIREKNYNPQKIAKDGFMLKDGRLALRGSIKDEVAGWEECREKVYDFVYANENLCPGSMLLRALSFAYLNGELTRSYFTLTDEQATEFLLHHSNSKTKKLVNSILHWQYYKPIVDLDFKKDGSPDGVKSLAKDWRGRHYLSDLIAEEFNLEPEDVASVVGHDKGVRKIHLPIINGEEREFHTPNRDPRIFVKVFVNPKVLKKPDEIQNLVMKILEGSEVTGLDKKYSL